MISLEKDFPMPPYSLVLPRDVARPHSQMQERREIITGTIWKELDK